MTLRTGTYREMAAIIARFTADRESCDTAIDGLFFRHHTAPTLCVHVAQYPCFALVVQGAKCLQLGTETFRYGRGDYLMVSLDLPVMSQVTEASPELPFLGLGMSIHPDRLNELLGRIALPGPHARSDGMRGIAVNEAPADLLDATLRLLRLLDTPGDIPAMAPLLEQEILYRLLTGPFGPRLLQIATAETPSNRIAQAIAWLRENYARPLRVEDLAERVGMSLSSLHHHFKAVTAMSPIQFQKQLRLHEARRLMFVEHSDVGTAGYSVGYQSPSQFSRDYSRLYGLSPLRDMNAARMQTGVQMAAE